MEKLLARALCTKWMFVLLMLCAFGRSLAAAAGNAADLTVSLPDGLEYPMLGLGCASGVHAEHVRLAAQEGYRLIDTAQASQWGYREGDVGAAVQSSGLPREQFVLQTKIHPEDLGVSATRNAFPNSLRALRTSYVDVLLVHKPHCWPGACTKEAEGDWRDAWPVFEDLHREGLTRAIGVCDFDVAMLADLMAMAQVKPSVVQNWMDPFHQDKGTRKFCAENSVVYQAYSLLGTQWVHFRGYRRNPVLGNHLLQELASRYQVSVAQIVLRWALQHNVSVIPAATRIEHLHANRQLDFGLDDAEMEAIDSLDGQTPTHVGDEEM